MTRIARRTLIGIGTTVLGTAALTACTPDQLADQYRDGDSKNYIGGDGTVVEWTREGRGEPVAFTGTTEDGSTVDATDYRGAVLVVNFWYAACAPCRAEAPDLQALNEKYTGNGAEFLGINVRDQADTAAAFAQTYGITYPSIIDTDGGASLAFAGEFAANAVPTTIVVDAEGRPAARILGRITSQSILNTLIADTIAEATA